MIAQNVDVRWHVFKGISLEQAAYDTRVTLKFLDDIESSKEKIFGTVRNRIVSAILKDLSGQWSEYVRDSDIEPSAFYQIENGVYVIRAGDGFELDYNGSRSPVMYIGKGKVRMRLQSHLRGKLFAFWQSLGTVPLDFHICSLNNCASPDGKAADTVLEAALIREFDPNKTGKDFEPLLNKRTPRADTDAFEFSRGWKSAVQRKGQTKTTDWLLRPADPDRWKGTLG